MGDPRTIVLKNGGRVACQQGVPQIFDEEGDSCCCPNEPPDPVQPLYYLMIQCACPRMAWITVFPNTFSCQDAEGHLPIGAVLQDSVTGFCWEVVSEWDTLPDYATVDPDLAFEPLCMDDCDDPRCLIPECPDPSCPRYSTLWDGYTFATGDQCFPFSDPVKWKRLTIEQTYSEVYHAQEANSTGNYECDITYDVWFKITWEPDGPGDATPTITALAAEITVTHRSTRNGSLLLDAGITFTWNGKNDTEDIDGIPTTFLTVADRDFPPVGQIERDRWLFIDTSLILTSLEAIKEVEPDADIVGWWGPFYYGNILGQKLAAHNYRSFYTFRDGDPCTQLEEHDTRAPLVSDLFTQHSWGPYGNWTWGADWSARMTSGNIGFETLVTQGSQTVYFERCEE